MLKSAASKVMWVGRATVFLVGLAVILALVFGVASTAFAHKGNKGFFHLGHKNVSKAVSTLVKQGPGPALSLMVQSGQPPLKVNSTGRVPRLNADMVDGKHASALLPGGDLPSGRTVRGAYSISSTTLTAIRFSETSISFGYRLPAPPTRHYIASNTGLPPTPECPGNSGNPQAAPGHLCVYEHVAGNVSPNNSRELHQAVDGRVGARVVVSSPATTTPRDITVYGTWAVTAP